VSEPNAADRLAPGELAAEEAEFVARIDAGKSSVGTYLYVIARSAAADIRKRPSSRPLMPVEDADIPPIPDTVDQIVDSMAVREALDTPSRSNPR
jgi:DNA-directed RNA polymerase specialized sigma24 family protein